MKYVLLLALVLFIGPLPYGSSAVDRDQGRGAAQITYLLDQFSEVAVPGDAHPAFLVFSYSNSNRAYTYDQALAALAFTRAGRRVAAERVLNGLKNLQEANGSWKFWYNVNSSGAVFAPEESSPISGAIAWVAMAVNAYRLQYGAHAFDTMAERALDYLASQRTTVEYLGSTTHPVRFSPDRPAVVSVEHNLDAYSAFRNAVSARHRLLAPDLRNYVEAMWDETHFHAGYDVDAQAPNRAELYLDTQSWGVLALGSHFDGLETNCANFFKSEPVTGFFDYHPTGRAPASTIAPPVWTEGSFGMLMAMEFSKMPECGGKSRAQILSGLETLVQSDGGVPYATHDAAKNFSSKPSVAGTAWLYFLRVGFNPFQPQVE